MKSRWIIGLIVVALLAGVAWFLLKSNLLRSDARVIFGPGERNLNALNITAPSGWKCIEFSKAQQSALTSELTVSSSGMSDCPLFGANVSLSNDYPSSGGAEHVPLEQPTLVYENQAKTYQIYVLITKDPAKYQQLK